MINPQQRSRLFIEIAEKIDGQLQALNKIFNEQIPKFNELVKQNQINAVSFSE